MSDYYDRTVKEHKGHTITIEWHHDQDMGEPWKEHDGHGIVSEWEHHRDKEPGERVLVSDRGSNRYYDIAATIKLARKDGWGLCDKDKAKLSAKLGHKATTREVIAEAVERDFEYLRRWCNDDWHWCGYVASIKDASGKEVWEDSLWGIDSDSQG